MITNPAPPLLNFGSILSYGWKLFWANVRSIFFVSLCVYVPILMLRSLVLVTVNGTPGMRFYLLAVDLLELMVGLIATMSITIIVDKSLSGSPIPWTQALRASLSRWGAAIGTGILESVLLMLLFLLFIIPGIIWSVYYIFWTYAVAIRGISGMSALSYSKRLVKGRWWRTLGISAGLAIIFLCVTMLFGRIFQSSSGLFENFIRNVWLYLVGTYFIVCLALFFINVDQSGPPNQS